MRLSIEVTSEQHKKLKAMAALQGETIKNYVLKRTLPEDNEYALQELERFLKPRIESAKNGAVSDKTVSDIFDEVLKESEY